MNDPFHPIQKTNKKETIVGAIICIGIVTLAFVIFYYLPLLDDVKREKAQSDYEASFTIHSIYHGFLGDYSADAKQIPKTNPHASNEYEWLLGFNGGTIYFQYGDKPIVPTKEELCKAKMSETDDCMDRMILGKLK